MASEASPRDSVGKEDLLQNLNREPKKPVTFPQRTLRSLLRFNPHLTSASGDEEGVRRLGKAELGPHAFEERMPTRLRIELENDNRMMRGSSERIIDVLSKLCEQDESVETAYLCNPAVQLISKTRTEGNLCGYRNIQMMISYITSSNVRASQQFADGVPSVLRLQELIEDAWDKGINSEGRFETGGIRGTRKYIGTPEAQALFRSLSIGCRAAVHAGTAPDSPAWAQLLEYVKHYYHVSCSLNALSTSKTHQTNLPPIYLQRPHHSLTIVGFETRMNGSSDLLVFDPAFRLSRAMEKLLGRCESGKDITRTSRQARALLQPFRRGRPQLRRHKVFETLALTNYSPSCKCSAT